MRSGEYLQSFRMFADGILIAKCSIGTHSNRWLASVRYIAMEATIAAANERSNCIHAVRVEATISDAQCTFVNIFAQLILIFVGHRLCIVAIRMIPIETVRAWFASESRGHINALSECIARLMHFTLKLYEKFDLKKWWRSWRPSPYLVYIFAMWFVCTQQKSQWARRAPVIRMR